jgi:hypothetical protein
VIFQALRVLLGCFSVGAMACGALAMSAIHGATRHDAVLVGVALGIIFAGLAGVVLAFIGPEGMPSPIPPGIDRLIPDDRDRR